MASIDVDSLVSSATEMIQDNGNSWMLRHETGSAVSSDGSSVVRTTDDIQIKAVTDSYSFMEIGQQTSGIIFGDVKIFIDSGTLDGVIPGKKDEIFSGVSDASGVRKFQIVSVKIYEARDTKILYEIQARG